MSKYTTEVRFICETAAGLDESAGFEAVDEITEKAAPKIFKNFPIFDEGYRLGLEKKILKHYYINEIGFETVGLWKLYLNNRLNEIMPYYNQLYKSELLDFNPFYDIDLTTKSDRNINGDEDTTSDSTSNSTNKTTTDSTADGTTSGSSSDTTDTNGNDKNRYSDTPQEGIDGVESDKYLTNVTLDDTTGHTSSNGTTSGSSHDSGNSVTNGSSDSTNNSTGNRTYSSTDGYLEHVAGKTGGSSYSSRLKEFRETFLNIDMLIIDELSDLFLNLW